MNTNDTLEQLKFPVGKFQLPEEITSTIKEQWIVIIASFPEQVIAAVSSLSDEVLNQRYRPEGWTIRQVLLHCVDSHMNSIIRFKLALTEDNPVIRPYREDQWALLNDTLTYSLEEAFVLLRSLHLRWVYLLEQMTDTDYQRSFIHPENNEEVRLIENLGIYAWHCEHHLQHILNAIQHPY